MNEQHEVLDELLGIASAPAADATGTMGMVPHDGRCEDTRVGLDSCHFPTPPALVRDPAFIALAVLVTPGV